MSVLIPATGKCQYISSFNNKLVFGEDRFYGVLIDGMNFLDGKISQINLFDLLLNEVVYRIKFSGICSFCISCFFLFIRSAAN